MSQLVSLESIEKQLQDYLKEIRDPFFDYSRTFHNIPYHLNSIMDKAEITSVIKAKWFIAGGATKKNRKGIANVAKKVVKIRNLINSIEKSCISVLKKYAKQNNTDLKFHINKIKAHRRQSLNRLNILKVLVKKPSTKWKQLEKDRMMEIQNKISSTYYKINVDNIIDFESDQTGEQCCRFACNVVNVDIDKLRNVIIKRDRTGEWCYMLSLICISSADVKRLQDAVIAKDKTGKWCYWFVAFSVPHGADVKKLEDAVIAKDQTGEWCYWFAHSVDGADIERLQNAVIAKDKTEMHKWYSQFACFVKGADIEKLEDAIIAKDKTGEQCYQFANQLTCFDRSVNVKKLEDAVIAKDHAGCGHRKG